MQKDRRSAPARSGVSRHPAVDHQLDASHVNRAVKGQDHPVCDVQHLPGPTERHPGFSNLVGITLALNTSLKANF